VTSSAALGAGSVTPYPVPSSPAATTKMRANRSCDTTPELRLRSAIHRRGLRFRKNYAVLAGAVRVRPDIVFTAARVAVFLDGCFWHRCEAHRTIPVSNAPYWGPKLERTGARDRVVDEALTRSGWIVVRVWEHDDPEDAALRVEAQVRRQRSTSVGKKVTGRERPSAGAVLSLETP
jgi:DNA mismatch endonuclease (patch repair protein)